MVLPPLYLVAVQSYLVHHHRFLVFYFPGDHILILFQLKHPFPQLDQRVSQVKDLLMMMTVMVIHPTK